MNKKIARMNMSNTLDDAIVSSLRRELLIIAVFGGFVLLIGFSAMGFGLNWRQAGLWLLPSGLLWSYVCLCASRLLTSNRADEQSPLFPALGWGNRFTLLRGGLIALTGGFLWADRSLAFDVWAPALFYTMAAVLDRYDGFWARRHGQVSLLGGELDIRFDALGLVIAPLLAVLAGRLHYSYLLLSAAFYLCRWGLQHRQRRGLPIRAVPDNPLRRTLAGFQMGFVSVSLWPWLDDEFMRVAGIAFALPVLFGFAADWWVVCGWLQAKAYARIAEIGERYFLPGLRWVLAPICLALLTDVEEAAVPGLLAIMILLGFAGRAAALGLLLWLGWQAAPIPPVVNAVLIFSASWLLLLGTGRVSVWRWGEQWLQRYDGA